MREILHEGEDYEENDELELEHEEIHRGSSSLRNSRQIRSLEPSTMDAVIYVMFVVLVLLSIVHMIYTFLFVL